MAYSVVESPSFHARLAEAFRFRIEYYGRKSARKLMNAKDQVVSRLSAMPLSGTLVNQESDGDAQRSLRWMRIDSYIAVYHVDEGRQIVVFVDLFSAGSNWRERVLS